MKTEFATLIKSMRLALRPAFKTIINISNLTVRDDLATDQLHQALDELEQQQMIVDNGYTQEEFRSLCREYYMDFSSDNPDEWIVKHNSINSSNSIR